MKKVLLYVLLPLVCISIIVIIYYLKEYEPELASQIAALSGIIFLILVSICIGSLAIYMKLFYDPYKPRGTKKALQIFLTIASFLILTISFVIYWIWQYFKFVTSGTPEGTMTGIMTIVATVIIILIISWMNKLIKAGKEKRRLEKEREKREIEHQKRLQKIHEEYKIAKEKQRAELKAREEAKLKRIKKAKEKGICTSCGKPTTSWDMDGWCDDCVWWFHNDD